MDKSINITNLIAYPCVIKNDQGNPTYGLLIRPSKPKIDDCNILDIQQQNVTPPVVRNQVFIPASAVPNFQQKFCNGQDANYGNTFNLQQSFSGENLYSGNELQHILDEIDTSDISSFLQELSYDSHELIHLDGGVNSSQLEIMDPMPSNMLADRLVLHHEQQQQQQPCCSKYMEQQSCRYQAPNDPPPPVPRAPVYHDVGTPDSGIQSIGESPRAVMQNSPAQPVLSNVYNPFFIQSPPPPVPSHRPSLMEPLMINIATPSSTNVDFEDMPRLEPENNESCNVEDEVENTNKLLDRLLSSLPAEQLANVSKLLDKKLKAAKSEDTPVPQAENDAAAKKLADYRQKMKQKRASEKLHREIENLCDRLNNITSDQSLLISGMKSSPCSLKFLHNIEWNKKKCVQESTVNNLEIESNDDVEAQTVELAPLKVKIRILRRELSHLQYFDDTQESSLPLKKRFKAGANYNDRQDVEQKANHDLSPAAAIKSTSDSRTTRSSKRKQNFNADDSCNQPLKLSNHQIDPCLMKKTCSVIVNKLSLGLLKKCQACSMWSKVSPSFREKKLKECRHCQEDGKNDQHNNKVSNQDSLLTSIRLLPPKKKFTKCGTTSDELMHNSASPFSPKYCSLDKLGSNRNFELPYDLWWHFVYQKNFICHNPSTNYKRIRNNIYVDTPNKMSSAPGCQPCACKSASVGPTCGDNCLNRLMFTECTPGVCPCGESCSNRRFQKRQWAPALDKFWTGAGKGFGVRTNELIKNGFGNLNDETVLNGFLFDVDHNCAEFSSNFMEILRKIQSNRPADNLMQAFIEYLLNLCSKNDGESSILREIYHDVEPLIGEYDPDRIDLNLHLWSKNLEPDSDKVRCLCGSFEDDGEMVQCDVCFYWLHADCINLKASTSSTTSENDTFVCNFCRTIEQCRSSDETEKGLRKQFCDIILEPQPDFKLPKCTYYKALMCGDLQIRLGDCVYLRRDVSDIQKRLLNDLNEECVVKHSKNNSHNANRQIKCDQKSINTKNQAFHRKDLRIMRVERLFIGPRNVRFMFGSYFAHHYETFCEPNRRFYKNEVFVTPLYDTWPLESSVVGRCLVLDPATYCKGRPCFPLYDEQDVFVCEYRVDKGQRLFDKSSSTKCGGRLPLVDCRSFVFRNFEQKLKICRNFTPFNDQPKNKSRTKAASTKIALSGDEIYKLSVTDFFYCSHCEKFLKRKYPSLQCFAKKVRLDQQIARIKNL